MIGSIRGLPSTVKIKCMLLKHIILKQLTSKVAIFFSVLFSPLEYKHSVQNEDDYLSML